MTTAAGVEAPSNPYGPPRLVHPLRGLLDVYLTEMRIAIAEQIQYRASNYFYMLGMVAEPVIYLVVWSTVATQQGGSVGGYTIGALAAYYIVWTLVRNINIVFTPYGWEWRIREGQLSAQLLRPLFPIVEDLGFFLGWKPVVVLLWLPIAFFLAVVFHPTITTSPLAILVFAFSLLGAYLIRSLNQSSLGLITFWTTRVGPVFQLYIAAELLLSGRLVPMSLMPAWVQTVADFLPFQYTFGFPIEALVGNLTNEQLLNGLLMQVFWIAVGSVLVRVVWHFAIRRYSAVSG
ncbi:MAG TPA: ABC-2 family transporter protein [Candidatus Polarisedimenticolia bacterium]|nr:ABC-2 family transporter protein [Candidatus Polarisedimenticolia bacterium]